MKILLATESYWPNRDGGSVIERNLVTALGEMGHEVRVVAPSITGRPGVQVDGRSDIHRLRSLRLPGKFGRFGARAALRPARAVRRLIDGFAPEVIHGHNFFGIGLAALHEARRRRIPYVATNHNMPENTLGNLGWLGKLIPGGAERLWQREIRLLNQANFVVSPTATGLELLVSHGLSVPHRAISNGVDLRRFNLAADPQALQRTLHLPHKPTVVYMGRIDGEKRLDVWLRAAKLVRREVDAHFVLGGRGGELPALRRLASSLGIAEHVTFAGLVSDDDLPAFYHLGNVFAISSPAELQSIVTLEAMAAGLPIVACDAGALPELCKSGRNGYLFLNGDPVGLANSVVRILQNPTMAGKMGMESRRIVETSHDVKLMPKRYLAVYKEIIGGT